MGRGEREMRQGMGEVEGRCEAGHNDGASGGPVSSISHVDVCVYVLCMCVRVCARMCVCVCARLHVCVHAWMYCVGGPCPAAAIMSCV